MAIVTASGNSIPMDFQARLCDELGLSGVKVIAGGKTLQAPTVNLHTVLLFVRGGFKYATAS